MALALHCTVEELGNRMSAQEFGRWLAYFDEEASDPSSQPVLWSRLMSVLANGSLARKDKKPFTPEDFLPRRWVPPPEEAPPAKLPPAALKQRLKAMFSKA